MKDFSMMTSQERETLSHRNEMESILAQERQIEAQRLLKALSESIASGQYMIHTISMMEGLTSPGEAPKKEFRLVLFKKI